MTTRLTSLDRLPGVLADAGVRRVLLLTGGSARFVERIRALIGDVEVFAGARRHVPEAILNDARARVDELGVDAIIALGGGSAIGLGKALRLERELFFVAVPTTYSGSELTDIYGITADGTKRTGRDARVRPDVVIHDVALTLEIPKALTVTSLMNALAHPIATLAAGLLPEERRGDALAAIARIVGALEVLVQAPDSARARTEALEGAALAAGTLEAGTPGLHHQLAHRLGGRFDLEHGALHSVLLPHTLHRLRAQRSPAIDHIEGALRLPDVEATLFDLLVRADVATSLKAMGVTLAQIEDALAAFPDVPADVVMAAYHGRRPSRSVRREDWGLAEPVSVRGTIAGARRVVVALHGRNATADGVVRRVLEIVGDDPEVAVVAPHARDNVWYAAKFTSPRADITELGAAHAAVDVVLDRVLALVPPERVALFGFSQGACLAYDVFARRNQRLAALVALSGGAIGGDDDELLVPHPEVAGTPALVGASEADPWMPWARIEATAQRLMLAGCDVRVERVPGATHALHLRHRLLARPLLSGLPAPAPHGGFGNAFESEALPGALPRDRNTPRLAPYGLYPEQLSVSPFTAPRAQSRRTWLYRVRPAARHGLLRPLPHPTLSADFGRPPEPNLVGFLPLPAPTRASDFLDGLCTLGGAGSAELRRGYAVHLYACDRNMEDRALVDADGDLVVVPQEGALTIMTELGPLDVAVGAIAIIPRGLRFAVHLADGAARGWVGETFGPGFTLPERGIVGANGLADARHFRAPHAWHEDRLAPGYRVATKLGGQLYEAVQDTSPFDVAAWHGNAVPFVYDLGAFSPVGNARVDHIDPSVHTVVCGPVDPATGADHVLDLIAFVPRWDATEGTFRPPYFHRNATTELNGVIREHAPAGSAFQPGVTFLTPSLTPHGAAASAVERNLALPADIADRPARGSDHSLWFQFESALPFSLTSWAERAAIRIRDWPLVWGAYRAHFRVD